MSALAAVGRFVDGGAAQGLYLLGLVPGFVGTVAVLYATRDNPSLTDEDRCARRIARYAAGVGGIATGFAGIGIVSVAGAIGGLSGAGIASGLTAVGSFVGGGMVASVGLLVAAPAIATGRISAVSECSDRLDPRCSAK
jgi:hypothetical protein